MGKYSKITPKLPKLVTPRSELIELLIADYRKFPITDLIKKYAHQRSQKKEVEKQLKVINQAIEALVTLIIPMYEEKGISSMKIATTGQTVSVQEEPVGKILDRDQFREWCKANDLERSLVLPYQTMNALVKERLLNGDPEPDGIEAYTLQKIVLRKK